MYFTQLSFIPFCRDLDSIYKLIAAALAEPFEPVAEVDSEEKELSRVQCSKSVLHQADQILRKLIAREMAENKGKQECIPVGCVPAASVALSARGGASA